MKKTFLSIIILAGLAYVTLSSHTGGNARGGGGNSTGSSGAGTGAATGCSCHSAATATILVNVELDSAGTPVSHYVGGANYTIKLSAVNNSTNTLPSFGFMLSAVLSNAPLAASAGAAGAPNCQMAGSWGASLPSGVQITTAAQSGLPIPVAEHNAPIAATTGNGATGSTYVVDIPWTAPATGSGPVVVYGTLLAVNGNNSSSGDFFNYAKTMFVPEIGHEPVCQ